ncbi:MAG: hypothetical protein H6Q69_96 [Firmicutes bacterium]|nr:hypothetical protein [Bacillota bacterium]
MTIDTQEAGIAQQTAEAMISRQTKQQILNTMNEVDFGYNISDQTQTISAVTEEQPSSMEEIVSASHHLTELAEKLITAIFKFKFVETSFVKPNA